MPNTSHSETRQFRCEYQGCGKVFNRRDYLERHATNHLEVKPYVCHQCNRSFSRKDLYDNHLTTKRHARLIHEAQMEASEGNYDYGSSLAPQHLSDAAARGANRGQLQFSGATTRDPRDSQQYLHNDQLSRLSMSMRQPYGDLPFSDQGSDSSSGIVPTSLQINSPSPYLHPQHLHLHQQSHSHSHSQSQVQAQAQAQVQAQAQAQAQIQAQIQAQSQPQSQSLYPHQHQLHAQAAQQGHHLSAQSSSLFSPASSDLGSSVSPVGSGAFDPISSTSLSSSSSSIQGSSMPDTLPYGSMFYKYDYRDYNYGYGYLQPQQQHLPPQQPLQPAPVQLPAPLRYASSSSSGFSGPLASEMSGGTRALKRSHGDSASSSISSLMDYGPRSSGSAFGASPSGSVSTTSSGVSGSSYSVSSQQSAQDRLDQDKVKNSELLSKLRDGQDRQDARHRHSSSSSISAAAAAAAAVASTSNTPTGSSTGSTSSTSSTNVSGSSSSVTAASSISSGTTDRVSTALAPAPGLEGDALARGDFDRRYLWFFDDSFKSDRAKYGYDRYHGETNELYHSRAKEFEQAVAGTTPPPKQQKRPRVSVQTAQRVFAALREFPESFYNDMVGIVEEHIEIAWKEATVVSYIVHKPTFDPNQAHISLLAVLTMIGMAISPCEEMNEVAKAVYPNAFLLTYEALNDDAQNTRYDASQVGHLQAFCLSMRYERTILRDDEETLSLTRYKSGRHIVDRFLWTALGSIPHLNLVPESQWSQRPNRRLVWASNSQDGYVFHQGAEPEAQWREWAAFEMCKRTICFAVYSDNIHALSNHSRLGATPVSIFNLDIHMICPDDLWTAPTAQEFFYITGPTNLVSNVPFLGLIKSMFRFPRAATGQRRISATGTSSNPSSAVPADDESGSAMEVDSVSPAAKGKRRPWSLFALRIVAYGLITIVARLLGLFRHQEALLDAIVSRTAAPPERLFNQELSWGGLFSERRIQARLYRGLDIWFQLFEEAYGNVTERLFNVAGSLGLKISEEFASHSGIEDDSDDGVPEHALIVVLYHYSSYIYVHEDLPIVLQVTSNLAKWLGIENDDSSPDKQTSSSISDSNSQSSEDETSKAMNSAVDRAHLPTVSRDANSNSPVALQTLLDYLYMPLYVQWVQTCEAKAMVSTSALYLTWVEASTGRMSSKSASNLFLSAVVYISVIVVWLNDLADQSKSKRKSKSKAHKKEGSRPQEDIDDARTIRMSPINLEDNAFIQEAVQYLYAVNAYACDGRPLPDKRPSSSLMMLGAAILHRRPGTKPLVDLLLQLVRVLEPSLSAETLAQTLEASAAMYDARREQDQQQRNEAKQDISLRGSPDMADVEAATNEMEETVDVVSAVSAMD